MTPSEVTYAATFPPSPEIMYSESFTCAIRSGPGGFAVWAYTTNVARINKTRARRMQTLSRLNVSRSTAVEGLMEEECSQIQNVFVEDVCSLRRDRLSVFRHHRTSDASRVLHRASWIETV